MPFTTAIHIWMTDAVLYLRSVVEVNVEHKVDCEAYRELPILVVPKRRLAVRFLWLSVQVYHANHDRPFFSKGGRPFHYYQPTFCKVGHEAFFYGILKCILSN